MKHKLVIAIFTCALVLGAGSALADKPVVAVAEFVNEVTGAHWWTGGSEVGWELSGMLTNEMAATGAFSMVERTKLEHVLNEQNLAASGRIQSGTGAKMGKLAGAQYLVMGTVTAFEESTKGTGGGIGYKGLRLGGKKGESYLAVDLRVVNATTGTVDWVRSVEARAKSKGVSVGAYRGGWSGSLAHHQKTPVGKAIRAMVIEASDYLECAMVRQDGCMADFDAKEQRRRESSKKSIKLD